MTNSSYSCSDLMSPHNHISTENWSFQTNVNHMCTLTLYRYQSLPKDDTSLNIQLVLRLIPTEGFRNSLHSFYSLPSQHRVHHPNPVHSRYLIYWLPDLFHEAALHFYLSSPLFLLLVLRQDQNHMVFWQFLQPDFGLEFLEVVNQQQT